MVILENKKTKQRYTVTDDQWAATSNEQRKLFAVIDTVAERPTLRVPEVAKPRVPEVVERVNTEAREKATDTKKKTGPASALKSGN